MGILLRLAILPVLLAIVRSELPIDFEEDLPTLRNDEDLTVYRLPEKLDPIHYDVEITPYFEATASKAAFTFDGIVTILVTAVEDGITDIIIQENVLDVTGVTVTDSEGTVLDLDVNNPFERLRTYQFLKINLKDGTTLDNGQNYIIRVVYLGQMNETPLSRGVFRGNYVGDDGIVHWYAATHLQPTHSRQAFPSFDEPGFKSTFNIIINRPANFGETFSNMRINQTIEEGDRVKEIFLTTPRMSAYLVTFHISEEFTVIADNNDPERSYRILARPNAQGQGEYALEVGPPLTEWLENYLGVPYYTMGEQMKNDQIASPYWASGATENWGLVTYRELRLLYEEGETNALDKMYVATITAHELAHKWFGNLVTARWWDNVWINEGYASYFEYFAMDAIDPSMELYDQFNVMYVQSALSTDSSVATRALQHTVNTPSEVTGHFSDISYSKGASLLNMLKHFLGDDAFRRALNYYLVEMSFEHAFPEDVYRGFAVAVTEFNSLASFPDVDITEFLQYWVDEPGYPVLNVDVNINTGLISLSQERFFISPTAAQTEQVWPLPLSFTTESNPNWEDLSSSHVMTGRTYEIQKAAGDEWVIFNIQQTGIYRVNYDVHTWELIASALKTNPSSIHHLNRAQIVDDVFALMRAERMSYELGFQVLEFLKDETNYIVWYPAITGFTWLRNRFLHLPDTLSEFDAILLEYLDTVVSDLTYDVATTDSLTRTLNRFFTLTFACNVGHEGCIQDSISKYNALVNNGVSVNPNLRRHVFCNALREGTYADWNFLYQRWVNSNNQADEIAMLRSLGCTTIDAAIVEFLELLLTDAVKAQDKLNGFTFLFMGHRDNSRKSISFFEARHNDVREVVGSATLASILVNLAAYTDEQGLEELEEWLHANSASIPEYATAISGITSARTSMAWGTQNADIVIAAAKDSAELVLPATMLLLSTALAMLLH